MKNLISFAVDLTAQPDRAAETTPPAIPPVQEAQDVTREIGGGKKFLNFPVKTGAAKRQVNVSVDGTQVRSFIVELADGSPDWWAPLDVTAWSGKKLTVCVDARPVTSKVEDAVPLRSNALDALRQSDTPADSEDLYRETLRPQLHFSARRGWLNDPNGLVFYNGEYHLFFQHNPYGWDWGNMHWGHAVSSDLVHWKELGEALYPDNLGAMFSGCAVVDWKNSSGLGKDGKPPLVLVYTATAPEGGQCLAFSMDGRSFSKDSRNPVIKNFVTGNRDPMIFWHAPTKKWVMVLYGCPPSSGGELDNQGKPATQHTIYFFTSPNLREWTQTSTILGGIEADHYLYECPNLFELPVDGDQANKKWVLAAANSDYAIGTFDGTTFTPEASGIPGVRGCYYAAQTFSDTPDGRRIQVGWGRAASHGMPFNQLITLPCELTLRSTPDGVRLAQQPMKELESLRDGPNRADALDSFRAELIELHAEFEPGDTGTIEVTVRGAKVIYDTVKQELIVNGTRTPAPLAGGKQNLVVFVDRTLVEVFAGNGLVYLPLPFIPNLEDQSVAVECKGGNAKINSLQVYKLKSIWRRGQ
ncbi:MAG: glycoside hydrolase family 32 protein [Verrucomicrobiae bacterium]